MSAGISLSWCTPELQMDASLPRVRDLSGSAGVGMHLISVALTVARTASTTP